MIAVAGTNDGFQDIQADIDLAQSYTYNQQFADNVNYGNAIDNLVKTDVNYKDYKVTVTGHSLGGAQAQILSHTFGWGGITWDAARAGNKITSNAYKQQLKDLGITAKGVPSNFENYIEEGSLVNKLPPNGQFLGSVKSVNEVVAPKKIFVSFEGESIIDPLVDAGSMTYNAYVYVSDLIDQHAAKNAISYFSDLAEQNKIERCFAQDTLITMGDKTQKPIQDIVVGDVVMAFDGLGDLVPCKVLGLKRGTTDEWVKLSFNDGRSDIFVTPNHEMLTADGVFNSLEKIINYSQNNKINLIDENGQAIEVFYKKMSCKSDITYNFEVEGLHTYVAGGIRVHNDCVYFLPNMNGWTQAEKDSYAIGLNNLKQDLHNGNERYTIKIDREQDGVTKEEYNLMEALAKNGNKVDFIDKNGDHKILLTANGLKQLAGNANIELEGFGFFRKNGEEYSINDFRYNDPNTNWDDIVFFMDDTADMIIEGVSYTADAVVGAVDSATKGLSEFLFDNDVLLGDSFNEALDGALYATLGKMASLMISGQNIDMAEMFKIMAKEIGYKFTSNVVTKTEMGKELSTYIDTKLGMNGYGKAAVGVLVEFGLRAVIDGKNWDADDYIKNASIAIVNAVTPIVVAHNVSSLSNGAGGLSQAGGAVVAAITTIVTALITDPKMNSGEYAMLYVQANIAATSYAIGAALAPASFGLSIIISAVAAAVMNEIVGELYWGKKFRECLIAV